MRDGDGVELMIMKILVAVASLALLALSISFTGSVAATAGGLDPHSPIHIHGDHNFPSASRVASALVKGEDYHSASSGVPPPYYEVIATVDQVWDGDTIDVWIENIVVELDPAGKVGEYCWPYGGHCGDGWEIVRFGGGIDAPESYEPGYNDATEFVESLIPPGTTVYLDLDNLAEDPDGRPYRGYYSRLIAVVYAEIDGQWVNINAELLRWGMEAYPGNDWDEYAYITSEFSVYDWPPYDNDYPYVLDFVERRDVMVLILPDENTGAPGENATFTVFIKNIGNVEATYSLIAGDNTGWNPMLTDYLIEHIAPNHVQTITLAVTIPEDAENCTRDNITVTATSQENAEVENSDSCIAHCLVGVLPPPKRGVRVWIDPTSKSDAQGENVIFTVTVTNTGDNADAYGLEATDTENWGPTLSVLSVTLAGGESETVELRITIPDNVAEGDSTTITVTATGTYSENSATCTATVEAKGEIPGVDVSISPGSQSGSPGGTLDYTVTVTNTGSDSDTYSLSATDTAGWALDIPSTVGPLSPGASDTATLRVAIPGDAENGATDSITVTATLQADTSVSDSASCTTTAVVSTPSPPTEGIPIVYPVAAVVIIVAIIGAVLIIKPF